ncbi:transcription antitermination factor NusG [Chitinophaga niastensis]|uniref:Transcription antitermination factor NusG n=1 Tax=Chitinophaga niastensis TaxID=536980 RepID=A0A2P8HHC9_CHINA|nr:UpxY family transcription antiterminator [Chitinophaga niastensis]PSL45606.1 transcription antitermination factor NusG [Chitinophaga niastensis]
MSALITGWYVIYTRPRHEKKVAIQLSDANIAYFLPTTRTLRIWKDRKKYVDTPLFPSYVFIYLEDMETYYSVLTLDGVLYYVRAGKEVVKVNENVIHNICLVMKEVNDTDIEVSDDYFLPGKQVMIKDGVLCGLIGEVVEVKGEQKILIRVNMLRKNILITLSCEYLSAIAT